MASKKKYDDLSNQIINLIGGKDNIEYFTHCVTRLRFNLKDQSLAKVEEIEKIQGVLGSQWQSGQLQVIIGQDVADVYSLIFERNGLNKEQSIDEKIDAASPKHKKKFKEIISSIFDGIAGCVAPCVSALIGGGMIKVILLVLTQLNILTPESGTYVTLSFVSDAPFYFLPVMVGANAAKKFGANMAIGITLGAVLIHPTFVSMVSEGTGGSIFGLAIPAKSYGSNVFAMILTIWIGAKVEKIIAKYSPAIIRSVAEPLLTFLIMAPLMLLLLAPMGAMIGTYLTGGLQWLYNTTGFFGLGILTALVPILVLTGMHMAFPPIALQNFAILGYDPLICIASIIPNFNQGAACAAVALKTRNQTIRSNASSASVAAIIAGVSEPALFGITLKYKTPLYAVMGGSFIGGVIAGIFQCYCYAFPGSFALFSFIAFIGDKGISNLIYMIIAVVVGMISTFILTIFLYKPEEQ